MGLILNIETSASVCSVALAKDGKELLSKEVVEDRRHAASLAVLIQELLSEKHLDVQDLDAVAVSKGPGSYTGLRIGVSTAKGLCFGGNVPLIGVSTLEAMASGFLHSFSTGPEPFFLCPMMDARRMEVYTSVFDAKLNGISEISAEIITGESFSSFLEKGRVYFFGEGMPKCTGVLTHPNACFVPEFSHSARFLCPLSEFALTEGRFEDVAYFEPFYLKDFMATVPKNKVLGGIL